MLSIPWYVDLVNYLACGIAGYELKSKEASFHQAKSIFLGAPYLYKACEDGIIPRCVLRRNPIPSSLIVMTCLAEDMQVLIRPQQDPQSQFLLAHIIQGYVQTYLGL